MQKHKGAKKNIFLALSDKATSPYIGSGQLNVTSPASVANIMNFESFGGQAGTGAFEQTVPFQLVAGAPGSNSSVLTLVDGSLMNSSQIVGY